MAKIIVAIEVPEGNNDDPTSVFGVWRAGACMNVLPASVSEGEVISVDGAYLRKDREDDEFYEFEFRGWEE